MRRRHRQRHLQRRRRDILEDVVIAVMLTVVLMIVTAGLGVVMLIDIPLGALLLASVLIERRRRSSDRFGRRATRRRG